MEKILNPVNSSLTSQFVAWEELAIRLVAASLLGFGVMFVYRLARQNEIRHRSFEVTLVLLATLIAVVTCVIGESVARAFSLVGALSIVRFRTVVRDTQDTAYVIFAVVIGMAAGAHQFALAAIGMLFVATAAFILRSPRREKRWPIDQDSRLNLRVALGAVLDQLSQSTFPKFLEDHQLILLSTAKQGLALEASYSVRLLPGVAPTDLVRELNKVEGVQNVELSSALAEVN